MRRPAARQRHAATAARWPWWTCEIDLGKVETQAVWDDLTSASIDTDLDRIAVVTGSSVLGGVVAAAGEVAPLTTKVFEAGQRDEAVV